LTYSTAQNKYAKNQREKDTTGKCDRCLTISYTQYCNESQSMGVIEKTFMELGIIRRKLVNMATTSEVNTRAGNNVSID